MLRSERGSLGFRQILSRIHKGPRWLIPVLISLSSIFYLSVMIFPIFYGDDYLLAQVRATQSYQIIRERALQEAHFGDVIRERGLIPLNPLINVEVIVGSTDSLSGGRRIVEEYAKPHLRYDILILFLGTWLIVVLVVLTTSSERSGRVITSGKNKINNARQTGDLPILTTADGILQYGMIGAQTRADAMFSRSTLLLAGGIIMAFLGVSIFYITLPSYSSQETSTAYLPKAIRPTGVLIFVEGIAWFLLRQYRALIEDYKTFHRIYLKRANFLAAYKLVCGEKVRAEDLFIAAALIEDDLTDKLKQGESTESLERARIEEPSPVFALVDSIIKKGIGKE